MLIYNGDFNLPTFIKLQAKYLEKEGYNVFIMGKSNNFLPFKIEGIKCIPEPLSQKKIIPFIRITSSFFYLLCRKPFSLFYFLQLYFKDYQKNPSKGKYFYFIEIVKLKILFKNNIDIIHINWSTSLPKFSHLYNTSNFKIICSFYGRITNISLNVNQNLFQLLNQHLPNVDGYHAVSKELAKNATKAGVPFNKIKVIPSSVKSELTRWNDEKDTTEIDQPLNIVSVARLHWKKGYDIALKGMAELKKQGINFDYNIIGKGEDFEINFLIRHLKLEHNVNVTGHLSHEASLRKIKKADLLLLPSVEEGIANVAIEAMALKTPIATSSLNGMLEVIEDKKNGFVFETRDFHDMAKKIFEISNYSAEALDKIKQNACESVIEGYTWEQNILEFKSLYNSAIKSK